MNNDNKLKDRCKEVIKRIGKNNAFTQDDGRKSTLLEEIKEIDNDKLEETLNKIKKCLCDNKYEDNVTEHIYTFNCDGNPRSIGQRRLHNIVIYILKGKFPNDTDVAKSTNNRFKGIVEGCGFTQKEKKDVVVQTIEDKIELLKYQKQIILQGPPGTGKTRLAKQMARYMIKGEIGVNIDDMTQQVKLIQFHPSYSYEDFVRGIVAKTEDEKGGIKYVVENKILAQMAKDAFEDKDKKPYILIVDEINRANLSSVLGELIYALEYRDEAVESMYELEGSRKIILPSNLYIIGTMNTADRSIGNMDYAIRRRFAFVDVPPIDAVVSDDSKFKQVQKIFDDCTSPDFNEKKVRLGHSYFIAKNKDALDNKLKYQVIPLLEEYISDGVLTDTAQKSIENLKTYIDSKK